MDAEKCTDCEYDVPEVGTCPSCPPKGDRDAVPAIQSASNALLDSVIPQGWRFFSCDASIVGRWSVMLIRDAEGVKWWHKLPEDTREVVPLYASGVGTNMDDALNLAVADIRSRI